MAKLWRAGLSPSRSFPVDLLNSADINIMKRSLSWVHANCVFDAAQLATVVYHQPSSRIVAGDLNMIVHTRGQFDCVKQGRAMVASSHGFL
ncbi:hypothetical protein GOBAR_DD28531 [Gossypium barbadense]|nr:hypothetical protein GOBAR_DD28531 [Gossypium barbadense]